jgi:hypothetical protein
MKRSAPAVLVGAAVLLAAIGIVSLARVLRQPGAIAEMRASVQELRAAADSCHALLGTGQEELLAYNAQLDSMRGRVREMEALHPRGVPADSYGIYMDVFRQYNDSVAEWGGRVDLLRAERERCVDVTGRHNAALDSLRRLLAAQRR